MPLINLTTEQAEKVLTGETKKLIRGERDRPLKPGDTLKFLERLPRRQVKAIGAAICTTTTKIQIYFDHIGRLTIQLDNHFIEPPEQLSFVKAAGFQNLEQFTNKFLTDDDDFFLGQLIEWEDLKNANGSQSLPSELGRNCA